MMHQGNAKHAERSRHVYQGRAAANFWGNRSCPPGLAKKHNGCLPPGIAKRSFNVGDRWNGNYGQWSYNQVPTDWRNQYNLNSDNRYYYRNGYLYSVDPKTHPGQVGHSSADPLTLRLLNSALGRPLGRPLPARAADTSNVMARFGAVATAGPNEGANDARVIAISVCK